MKTTKFYPTIWQTIPYSFELIDQWDAEGRRITDLILKNSFAIENGVSEFELNINKLSAFDKKGKEHFIADFPQHAFLNVKGLHTGHFIKSKSVLELKPGEYRVFRFYLDNSGNSMKYSDRSIAQLQGFGHLDFEIQNLLKITGAEAREVILRFDLEPYSIASYFKSIRQFFKKYRLLPTKMARSYGN